MSEQADRLSDAAGQVREARAWLDAESSNLAGYVSPLLNAGPRTWQGPAAERFAQATTDRSRNLQAAVQRLEDLARKMRERADQLRREEVERNAREAAAQAAARSAPRKR